MIIDFPDSRPALEDLALGLEKTSLRSELTQSLQSALENRLLHPGTAAARRRATMRLARWGGRMSECVRRQRLSFLRCEHDGHYNSLHISNTSVENRRSVWRHIGNCLPACDALSQARARACDACSKAHLAPAIAKRQLSTANPHFTCYAELCQYARARSTVQIPRGYRALHRF